MQYLHHEEQHFIQRAGWLRAAVLGANDGIISVTSLIMGMAASGANANTLMITCVAGLIAGASSMAAGEYISVKSQTDIEEADLKLEHHHLVHHPEQELEELTQIYIQRGLAPNLAAEVAQQLTAHDVLAAHARDEIGIHENTAARPLQAAGYSALAFSMGAFCPMIAILISPATRLSEFVAGVGMLSLILLGALSGHFSGTSKIKSALRVTLWGILAMLFSHWIGSLFQINPTQL